MGSPRDLLNFKAISIAYEQLQKKDDANVDTTYFEEFRKQLNNEIDIYVSAPLLQTNAAFTTFNKLCDRLREINIGMNLAQLIEALDVSMKCISEFEKTDACFKALVKAKDRELDAPTNENRLNTQNALNALINALGAYKKAYQDISSSLKSISNPNELEKKLALIETEIRTLKTFKIDKLETRIADFQKAVELGKKVIKDADSLYKICTKRRDDSKDFIQKTAAMSKTVTALKPQQSSAKEEKKVLTGKASAPSPTFFSGSDTKSAPYAKPTTPVASVVSAAKNGSSFYKSEPLVEQPEKAAAPNKTQSAQLPVSK